jgi:hypothetical protein
LNLKFYHQCGGRFFFSESVGTGIMLGTPPGRCGDDGSVVVVEPQADGNIQSKP